MLFNLKLCLISLINKKIKNATPTTYKGVKYRSKLEVSFAKFFEKERIKAEYEPFKVTLLPSFRYNGEAIRAITYTPDFIIDYCGRKFIIEVKGFSNDAYKIKKKLILKYLLDNHSIYTFYEVKTLTALRKILQEIKEVETWKKENRLKI